MLVKDLMVKDAAVCYANGTLDDAAHVMWQHNCGFVPVVESPTNTKVVGVITDRDVCISAYTRGAALRELWVADAMTQTVRTCKPEDSLIEAERRLAEGRVRRLPVVDDHGRLVGVLSLADLAREAFRERSRSAPQVMESEVGALLALVSEARQLPVAAS